MGDFVEQASTMRQPRRTLLIVEDDGPLLEALLEDCAVSSPDWQVIGASSLAQTETLLQSHEPHAAFIDLGLPDGDGLSLIRTIKQRVPACEVLVITVFADESRVFDSLRAGASGYLLKSELPLHTGRLVDTIAAGGSPLSPSIARYLITRLNPSVGKRRSPAAPERLTDRELEILGLCAKGLRYGEIGKLLGLSPHTVNAHLRSIFRKLMVTSRAEAVYEARQIGVLPD